MRLNILLVLHTVSALVSTTAAYQVLDFESDQQPFVDLDEGAPFFGVSEKHQRPPHYAGPPAEADRHKTIFEVLKDDERFTRLTKAIKFVDGIDDILDDEDAHLTFFAPPDDVLRRPHENDSEFSWSSIGAFAQSSIDLPSALSLVEDLESTTFDHDKHDKDHCKKILKIIIKALLEYHILPAGAYDEHHLGKNQTFSTDLSIPGALGHHPQRIRVQSRVIPPATIINYYSRISYGDWKASNGIIHVVDHPLIPPPSVFETLYMFPHFFSTFTSVLQRSNLTSEVDHRYIHGSGWTGSDSITVFAPMNNAFDRLPRNLKLYLFSPWGARALKKLLEYHIVPGAVLFTDEIRFEDGDDHEDDYVQPCACADKSSDVKEDSAPAVTLGSVARLLRGPGLRSVKGLLSSREVITNTTYDVDTLLCNHTVRAQVLKSKITYPFPGPKKPSRYETILFVNDRHVLLGDVPARNGVVHVVRRILNPHCKGGDGDHDHPHHPHEPHHPPHGPPHGPHDPHHPHKPPHHPHDPHGPGDSDDLDDSCWQDWENWLPQWANSD